LSECRLLHIPENTISFEILQKDYNHDCAHDLFFLVADRQAGRTIVFANYKPTLTQAHLIIELIVGPATKTEVQRCATTTTITKTKKTHVLSRGINKHGATIKRGSIKH
jgi:hypothetical protein